MRRRIMGMLLGVATVGVAASACEPEPERRDDRFGDGGAGGTTTSTGGPGGGPSVGGSSTADGGSETTTTTSSTTTGGGGCSYASPNSCTDADTVEEIAGDSGGDIRTITGTTSRFVKVHVAETVGSVISFPELKLAARLDDSPGMDFDMVVHDGAMPTCDGDPAVATTDPEYVQAKWGDNKNSDDSRWFVFEIVHNSGTACGSDAEWTLTLAGNYYASCQDDGMCTTDDDCVCPDCSSDSYCSDPNNCNDDGECDTYNEGCVCNDCAPTPMCL